MTSGVQIETVRSEMHGKHLLQLRLNQIFESISPNELFYTDTHHQGHGTALYFTFNNGVDHDPEFCGEIDGVLFVTPEIRPKICLLLKDRREEIFLENIKNFSLQFFDQKEKIWVADWKEKTLPPMLRIQIDDKVYSYILPRAQREVSYK